MFQMKKKTNLFARAAMTLLLAVLASFMAVGTSFAAGGNPTNGTCGDNDAPEAVTWSFNMVTGTLTISGTGAMADYESAVATPWNSWATDITSIILGEGVTRIGNYAFCGLPLKSILPQSNSSQSRTRADGGDEPVASVLPDGLITIGNYALSGTLITSLTLPETVINIGEAALSQNSNLTSLTCLALMTLPSFEGDILEGCNALTAIYVPETVVEDYKDLDCWKQYATLIQAIPEQGEEPSGDDVEPVNGSEVVSIGDHNRSNSSLPIDQYSKYSLSQQIYTKEEIGKKGLITSIAFYGYDYGMERTCDIYMTPTTKNSFESGTDWVTVAPGDKVFSGQITVKNGQWTIIDFDTPYEYDGKTNLLVTVDDNSNVANSSTVYWGTFNTSENQAMYYKKWYSTPVNLDPTQPIEEEGSYTPSKNGVQLCFETYPKPYQVKAVEVGDVSAQIQCSLRGDATTWNLRYRKVAGEGEEESRWTVFDESFDTRSVTLEELSPATKYEMQVQAVFAAKEEGGEDILSDWTSPLVFTTNCCPVEDQAEIIYAVNSNYSSWYGYAIQFMDITDENNPVEAAYVNPVDYSFTGGTLTLCCGHKYKVNWIYDEEHSNVNHQFSLALFFEPGDKFFSMARGEAPEETAELTTFVMDCTPYCTQMPQILNEAGTTYNSATLTFLSETKKGQVVYSTEADFDPEEATPEDMDFEELPQSNVPWEQPNASVTLKGLQPLTAYYVRVRSVCTIEPLSTSRWTPPVKVTTGSLYDAPTQVIAEPIDSHTEGLSWGGRGNEMSHNLYYRKQAAGNPVDPSAIQTFGGGNGTGFGYGSWGEGIWNSYGDRPFSNTIFVSGVPAGSLFRFLAGNGKTGAGQTKFLYGMQELKNGTPLEQMKKFDKKCLNDADRAAIIKELQNKIKELTDEQQIAAYNAEIEELNSLPTDAQKLEEMKTLEQKIKENNVAKAELTLKFVNGEITNEQYESKIYDLEVKNTMFKNKLSELRAITINAEDPNNDGFSITKEKESPNARTRGTDDDTYIFFIRHSDPNGVLLVKDLTITPPEQVGEWTVIKNISKTEYTLTGLEPGTAYEVMVEPIYEDGTTGTQSPITIFTTIGAETDPSEGVFSVAKDKKVQFAKGNLRYSGDSEGYEYEWSMAKQQYEILGEANIDGDSPAYLHDLFCWSTTKNYCGVDSYPYDDDPDAYFKGDFVDWGTDDKLASNLGTGWSTLTKDEWGYLLTERENAATKKAVATITIDDENSMKGILLLPDEWTAPTGAPAIDGSAVALTLEQWTALETAGAVFLPAAGQMISTYDSGSWTTTTNLTEASTYWTSTPSGDKSDLNAIVLTIGDEGATIDADLYRRVYTAVRLVKEVPAIIKGDANNDGKVDIADIVYVVAFIKDGTRLPGFNEKAADADGSGEVDENDITAIENIIMTP